MRTGSIDYGPFQRRANLHLVRLVLEQFRLGENEVYLSFDKSHPGVVVPRRVRDLPGGIICAVLHHAEDDLKVTETQVAATLNFRGQAEHYVIPFDALTVFYDCRTPMRLEFQSAVDEPSSMAEPANDSVVCFDSFRRQRPGKVSA